MRRQGYLLAAALATLGWAACTPTPSQGPSPQTSPAAGAAAERPAQPSLAPGASGDSLHLRVLATHDFHGALRPTVYEWSEGRPVGGAPALSAWMDSLEVACACPTLRVDGGDQMQGTLESNLFFGHSSVLAFNHLGLDAAAVGNHELDWGVDTLRARQGEAEYAWMAANVFLVDDGRRPDWARPWTMIEESGVRVGVVGYATVSTPRTLRPAVTRPYEFRSGYEGIREALDSVWARNPDFVILVAHAGGGCDDGVCGGELAELASELPPGSVHLMTGGHTHTVGEGVVNGIPIVRASSSGRGLAVVDLYRTPRGEHAFHVARETVYADAVDGDQSMAELLAPYLAAAEDRRNERITILDETLTSSARGDRRLGNLIAESSRIVAEADFGLHNPGGVRADLLRGPVSYADVHRVLPFDNTVVRVRLTGSELRGLIEQTGPHFYYTNLVFEWAQDARRATNLRFDDGAPVLDDGHYTLGTNDFLAAGGDGLAMLADLPRDATGVTVLDALIRYLRENP